MIQTIAHHNGTSIHLPTAIPATIATSRINIGGRMDGVLIFPNVVRLDFEMLLDRATQVVVVEMGVDFGRRDVAMTE